MENIDWWTIGLYLVLVTCGWFSVCGASYDYGEPNFFDITTRAGKQLMWIGCSLGLGFVILMLEDRIYDTYAYLIYGIMLLLLFGTIFNPHEIKGSRSWIVLGPVSLQPAEFAKFATALALGKYMNEYTFHMQRTRNLVTVLGIILLPMALIILQKETGSALVYLSFFLMLYREGMTGTVLFSGICAVIFFIVGLRFSTDIMPDGTTSWGEFSVLTLIILLSAFLYADTVNSFPKYLPIFLVLEEVASCWEACFHAMSSRSTYAIFNWCSAGPSCSPSSILPSRTAKKLSLCHPLCHRFRRFFLFYRLCIQSGA